MKPRSERDKRYEEKHKNERKAKNVVWGTSIPRETAEEVDAFLKKHGYTKVKLIEEGYKSLLEQAGVFMEREHSIHPEREHSIRTIKLRRFESTK